MEEENHANEDDNVDTEDDSMNQDSNVFCNSSCISCSSPCTLFYCEDCWKIRKSWLPYKKRIPVRHILSFKKQWRIRKVENSTTKQSFYKIWSVKIGKKKKHKRKRKVHKEDEKHEYLQEKCIFCNSRPINTAIVHGKSSHKVIS